MKSRLFKILGETLEGLSSSEIEAELAAHREIVRKIAQNDAELIPTDQFTGEDVMAELQFGVEQIKRLEAELEIRTEAEGAFTSQVAELAAQAGVDVATLSSTEGETTEGETETETEAPAEETETETETETPAEPGGELETETVVAAAPPVLRRPLPRPQSEREAVVVEDEAAPVLVASAGIDGVGAGDPLDRLSLASAMMKVRDRVSVRVGERTDVVVASARWNAPPERQLRSNDDAGNLEKILAVAGPEALVAAGGLCAPLTPIYALPQISTEQRPLRDALPPFQADRGGITWATPPSIADVNTAIGIVTAENDALGGTFAAKTCQFLDCQDFNSAEVDSIYHCLEWGNLGSRAWPERVAQFTDVVMAAWARLAETNILNQLKAGSTQVTAAAATYGYGALSDLTSQVLAAAAGYRSRFRMDPNARFRFVAPAWVRDLILSDLINAQFDRFAIQGYAGVDSFLRERGVDPVWTLDGETGGAQVFGAQNAGALLGFPDEVKWFLFPEGTWIFLDAGVLELGIVRDSVLNAENVFQVFGESFETVAKIGYQSLEITSALCPNGSTGGPATLLTC